MSVIVVNPSDMTSKPDFNILNDNIIKKINYSYNEIKYDTIVRPDNPIFLKDIDEIQQNRIFSDTYYVWDENSKKYIGDSRDKNSNFINIYQNVQVDIPEPEKPTATIVVSKYNVFKFLVTLPDSMANIDFLSQEYGVSAQSGKFNDDTSIGYIESDNTNPILFNKDISEYDLLSTFMNISGDIVKLKPEYYYGEYKEYVTAIKDNGNNSITVYILAPILKYDFASHSLKKHMANYLFSLYVRQINTNTINVSEQNQGISLLNNELTTDKTKIRNTQISEYIADNIKEMYKNGKQTVTLTTYYCEYKDIEGNVVYNGKDGKMIKVGDTIKPMIRKNDQLIPLSQYPNGKPRMYDVVSSSVSYNGVIKNTLTCIENTFYNLPEYTLTLPISSDITVNAIDSNGNIVGNGSVVTKGESVTITVTKPEQEYINAIYANDVKIENGATIEIVNNTIIEVEYWSGIKVVAVPAKFETYSEANAASTLSKDGNTYLYTYNENENKLFPINGTNLFKYEFGYAAYGVENYFEKVCSGYITDLGVIHLDFENNTPTDWLFGYTKGDLTISIGEKTFTAYSNTNNYSGHIVRLYSRQGVITRV